MSRNNLQNFNEEGLSDRFGGTNGMNSQEELRHRQKRSLSRFSGISLFDDTDKGLTKTITITNASTAAKKIAVFPATLISIEEIMEVAGVKVDAIAKQGTANDVTVECEGLAFAQRYFTLNPTRLTEISVRSTKPEQFSHPIEMYNLGVFSNNGSRRYVPANQQRQTDANNATVSLFFDGQQLDDQTCWIVNVAPNATVAYTFFTGEVRNDATLLRKAVAATRG